MGAQTTGGSGAKAARQGKAAAVGGAHPEAAAGKVNGTTRPIRSPEATRPGQKANAAATVVAARRAGTSPAVRTEDGVTKAVAAEVPAAATGPATPLRKTPPRQRPRPHRQSVSPGNARTVVAPGVAGAVAAEAVSRPLPAIPCHRPRRRSSRWKTGGRPRKSWPPASACRSAIARSSTRAVRLLHGLQRPRPDRRALMERGPICLPPAAAPLNPEAPAKPWPPQWHRPMSLPQRKRRLPRLPVRRTLPRRIRRRIASIRPR